ncbi:hypothetical protein ZYGR_0H04890 [Zygosaccharomyces rouxii]|uniref:TECPR1-like DysF domain-containing protein n=1 Tax=Zygosaccharomyces rouxii TaxID=4956 RepID=A0A1Q2ZWI0_ZYGRO|nr:integral peroxisomal membrane peroxin-domain-containing protein [Zygosaccharomyces rouxii]GAV47643.1 hypothetical protein ZYGR_0H04890 [Zygosaccharomyces rouxii]
MSAPRKREIMKTYFTKRYEKVLDSLMVADTTAAVATLVNGDSKRASGLPNLEVVHGVASSLFNASLEKLKPNKDKEDLTLEKATESSDEFWKDENFKQEIHSESPNSYIETDQDQDQEASKVEAKTRQHFIDIFVEKLIAKMVPERLPERERLFQSNSEDEKLGYQTVSATKLTQNLKDLSAKTGGMFETQDTIVRLLTWRNPSGTITMLILLTMICFNPMCFLMFPLLYIMYAMMVPGYMRRHPLRRTLYPIRRANGKSLLRELANGGIPKSSQPPYSFDLYRTNSDSLKDENVNNGAELVANIRDFQNATTSLLSFLSSLEKFKYGTAGFKDERFSTLVFLAYFIGFCILGLVSPYINWSLVISFALWFGMLVIHPKTLPRIKKHINTNPVHHSKRTIRDSEKYDVILDEPPEVRFVEIFEIYEQGITPRHWEFFKISSQVFDSSDKFRKLQKPPPGVDSLSEVLPPKTWSFDENSQWEVDYDAEKWAFERGLLLPIQEEFLTDDMFKRRRLTRKVLRYANPIRKPFYKYK